MKIQKASKAGTAVKSKAPKVGITKPKSKQQQIGQTLKMVKKIKPNVVPVSGLKAKGASPKSPVEGLVKKIKRATVKSNGQEPSVEGLVPKIKRATLKSNAQQPSVEGLVNKSKQRQAARETKTKQNKRDAVFEAKNAAAQLMFGNTPPEEHPEDFVPEVPPTTEVLVPKERLEAALKKYREHVTNNADLKKKMFDSDLRYGFQIVSIKKVMGPKKQYRIPLPHSLLNKDSEICLIVKDVVQGFKCDHEKSLLHWQDKLRELGVDFISEIIPFQQLKKDFSIFEMQRKLHQRFDRFLVDSRVGDHALAILGSRFYKNSMYPTQVSLERDEKVKHALESALRQVTFASSATGAVTQIPFATHTMPFEQAIENGMAMLQSLKTTHPGGWANIRIVSLRPMTVHGIAVPLYISYADPNLVPVPVVDDPRVRKEKECNVGLKAMGSAYEVRYNKIVHSKKLKRVEKVKAARVAEWKKSREAKAQNKKVLKLQTADPGN